ncbi:MAG TPA: ATP-binding cassette domain-containing protein [Actinomycetota bacterium]|nr:ATP-binding cassette domain-containing protein [Actinomycetota bacterium]
MAAIEVNHLTKRFGDVTAVSDLSFSVEEGTITGFVGPNGAGKSTTLRAILGLISADSGEALIDGVPYRRLVNPPAKVGAVLETGAFHPGRRARDHLRVLASAAGVSTRRVDETLEAVGLAGAAARRVGGFSLGMRQRLGLAGAMLAQPEILVLDEPANGLDPAGVRWLRDTLRNHAEAGGTVLLSSHVIAELALSADHLVIVKKGHLVTQGTVDSLMSTSAGAVVVRTPDRDLLLKSLSEAGMTAVEGEEGEVLVTGSTPEAVGKVVAASGVVVYEMHLNRPQLEDVILELTGGGERR